MRTPLMEAARHNHVKIGRILIHHGAEVLTKNPISDQDALLIAQERGHERFADLLMEHIYGFNSV